MKRVISALAAVLMALGLAMGTAVAPADAATPAWPVVKSGQTSANVKAVQHLLTARGHSTTADGIFGSGTKAKVVAFQKSKGLAADGIVGANTWPKLTSAMVREGNQGNDVKAAQTLLNKYGYGLTVDGVFGPLTTSAVKGFQRAQGLAADGIVGPKTWQHLAGGSGSSAPVTPTNCANVTGPVSQSETTTVTVAGYTFRVHKCLAPNLKNLLTAANKAGHTLGGWGYRSYESQVALRRQNCGTTHYAIYQKPASQCSPPTAIPGRSRHERGLALDFNSKGKSLTASDFSWLKANAGRYGLKNLPSERWHWSTDGA
jgi:peptidoglycan hydrolase-like protein with peptidoglycan-binding domain